MLRKLDLNIGKHFPTVLGIDGALSKTGICVIHQGDVYVGTLVIPPSTDRLAKLVKIQDKLNEVLDSNKIDLCGIEGYSFQSVGKVFQIAEAGAAMRLLLYSKNIPTVEVPPTTLKKYITGDGRAKKTNIASTLKTLFNVKFSNSDEADAFCLAIIALDYFSNYLVMVDSYRPYLIKTCNELISFSSGNKQNVDYTTYVSKKYKQDIAKAAKELNT